MRPLRYSINVTLDGCCHHEAGLPPDEESMRYWTAEMGRAEPCIRPGDLRDDGVGVAAAGHGHVPDWTDEGRSRSPSHRPGEKAVVSSTLSGVDSNAELVRGDLGQAVQRLKQEPGEPVRGWRDAPPGVGRSGTDRRDEFSRTGPSRTRADVGRRLRERIQLEPWIAMSPAGAVAQRYRPTRVTA